MTKRLGLTFVLLLGVLGNSNVFASTTVQDTGKQTDGRVLELFSASPAVFIENTGQIADSSVRYVFYGNGANIYHTTEGAVFQLFKKEKSTEDAANNEESDEFQRNLPDRHKNEKVVQVKSYAFSAHFVGSKTVRPTGAQKRETKVNYYSGSDPNNWRTNVTTYAEVVYPGIYKGIDLHTFGRRSHLKYEFHVRRGANYSQIVIRYEGIDGLSIDNEGRLHIRTPMGELVDDAPFVYQIIDGKKVELASQYCVIGKAIYTVEIRDEINPEVDLMIDPDLTWASYLGGGSNDWGYSVATDSSGNVFVAGETISTNFPVPGGFDTSFNGGDYDAFVAKVTNLGQLSWSSYLGGRWGDYGHAVAVDSSGNVIVTGTTYSDNFPTQGGFDTSHNGSSDAFVVKVTNSGQLSWSSYLGGSSNDNSYGVTVDSLGNIFLMGGTGSTNFPVPGGFDTSFNGGGDAFLAKVTSSGGLS